MSATTCTSPLREASKLIGLSTWPLTVASFSSSIRIRGAAPGEEILRALYIGLASITAARPVATVSRLRSPSAVPATRVVGTTYWKSMPLSLTLNTWLPDTGSSDAGKVTTTAA